jgi:hypothetical protein
MAMRVFVPVCDEWCSDPRFAGEPLVPYRAGMALAPGRRLDDGDSAGLAAWREHGFDEAPQLLRAG